MGKSFSALMMGGAVVVAGLALPAPAYASGIHYSFAGTISNGSSMDLGHGQIDLSGASFVVSGTTMNEQDLSAADTLGVFAATSFYDFGSLGAFGTDWGTDYFLQSSMNFDTPGIGFVGLGQNTTGQFGFPGFQVRVPNVSANPNVLTALGVLSPLSTMDQSPRRMTNSAGQTLTLAFSFTPIRITSAEIEAVPEPASLTLIGLGMSGLAAARARRRNRKACAARD